ncbi:response regulator [Pseudomonas sp. NPDC086278]|uniref:response regulator n=1 Tax=Pseudomonas sp. NPDC086278 TaxID=3390646 RepID=UPI003D06D23A
MLALSWCAATGLSAWRTYHQLENESLNNLSERLRLLTSVDNDDFRDAQAGAQRMMMLWNSGAANDFGDHLSQRLTMHWVSNSAKGGNEHLLSRAAAAAEAFGAAGQSMIVDTFFYFPNAGASFSTAPNMPADYAIARASRLRELFASLGTGSEEVIWDGPRYEPSLGQQMSSVVVVSRNAQGKPLFMAGYELKLDERLRRMQSLLDQHDSVILNSNGDVIADLSQRRLEHVSAQERISLINSVRSGTEFPQITRFGGAAAVVARIEQPGWYLVSTYRESRLRAGALQTIAGEIIFALIGFVLSTLGLLIALRRQLALPLAGFAEALEKSASSDDLSQRLPADREDELGRFAKAYNSLLDAMQAQHVGLENVIETRTHELKKAREIADRANELKGQFLANMSHEIRTPMNAVIGMSHMLADTPLSNQQKHFVKSISENSDALLTLINDILDLSKIESGSLVIEFTVFDLIELVEEVVDLMAVRAAQKSLRLICQIATDVPQQVLGDPWRIRQILLNLVSNAVKFTTSGSIRLVVFNATAGRIGFHVIDTGIGIEDKVQSSIFDAFIQADASITRHYGGTGLGLSISKRLAELMDGTLSLQSEPGAGSTFTLVLMLEPRRIVEPDTKALWGLRTLVVDEHPDERQALIETLGQWGMLCQGADSAAQALEAMQDQVTRNTAFDLVLVNHRLPFIDALAFADECRNAPQFSQSRVVLTATHGDLSLSSRTLIDHGIAASITRPARRQVVYKTLCQVREGQAIQINEAPEKLRALDRHDWSLDVLVVDDIATNREISQLYLERFGHRVTLSCDGLEALEAMGKKVFDTVLMDGQMPRLDGIGAIEQIRSGTSNVLDEDIWIIALTANAMSGDQARFLGAGASDYLSKPVLPDQLFAAIDRVIEHQLDRGIDLRPMTALNADEAVPPAPDDDLSSLRTPRLRQLFLDDCDALLFELRQAVSVTDFERATRAAHSLKGSSGQFAEALLETLATRAEQAAQAENATALTETVEQLHDAVSRLKSA